MEVLIWPQAHGQGRHSGKRERTVDLTQADIGNDCRQCSDVFHIETQLRGLTDHYRTENHRRIVRAQSDGGSGSGIGIRQLGRESHSVQVHRVRIDNQSALQIGRLGRGERDGERQAGIRRQRLGSVGTLLELKTLSGEADRTDRPIRISIVEIRMTALLLFPRSVSGKVSVPPGATVVGGLVWRD